MPEIDAPLTIDDFRQSGWKDILDACKDDGWPLFWHAFSVASERAKEAGDFRKARVLSLLSHACSMSLAPSSATDPFVPMLVLADGRSSASFRDLSDADIDFFASFTTEVDESQLRARLADMVWIRFRKRFTFALEAIDAYRNLPLNEDTWINNGRLSWERAISLSMRLKAAAGSRLSEIETSLTDALRGASDNAGFFALWIADALEQYGLGRSHGTMIATHLTQLADAFAKTGDVNRTTAYYSGADGWFVKEGDVQASCAIKIKAAKAFADDAAAKIGAEPSNFIVASMQYEKAIHQLRGIPNAHRADFGVTELIDQYHGAMSAAQQRAIGQMQTIRSKPVNLEETVQASRDAVRGLESLDALAKFAAVSPLSNVARLRANAEKRCSESLFGNLFGSTYLSPDGRVVARLSAAGFDRNAGPDELAIFEQMTAEYRIRVDLVSHGCILPALEVLREEQQLREQDFVLVAEQSPLVPPDRTRLYGKALSYGFEGDMVAALHVLVPQIENMIRYHLKQAGAKTTTLDAVGIEMENGMSTLVDMPEMRDIFSDDLIFELKALFCSQFGPNLRNQLAHGLMDDTACFALSAHYAWWLGLKIIYGKFS
ncbi:DUF4209 domain-containing protein [Paraburkholderia sp. RL17-337-BIB-A]|uniref:DUF4209 domain-containing protein n=1 Tax=Paraburkholderia sp. RL17-337-BIB-A TaxID=3031636 RepID=UPI0038BCD62B